MKKKQTKKQKIAALNLVNGDDKCLQYVATVALNDEKNGKRPEVMLKIKPFINTFTQKGKSYPSGKDDWKWFEMSNPTIPLNVLYVKKTNVYPTYIQMKSAKDNSNQEKQIIILIS